jgi:histidinol-phosphate/aromatic aminotransferase/cobyric acid decarboxylase-like protein
LKNKFNGYKEYISSLLISFLIALLISIAVFTAIYLCGEKIINEYVSSDSYIYNTQAAYITSFQKYVSDNKVSSNDFKSIEAWIQREKHFLKHELTKIFGDQMKIFPSEANFLLLKTQLPLYRLLLERGILIRNCANYTGLGQDFYRIAVKGHPENVQLIEALLDIKKKGEEKRYGKH